MLILCIGDLHIPHRASDIPPQFKELLKPGKIHSILSTGNLCSKDILDYLKSLTADIHLVNGDFDSWSKSKEENLVLELAGFRIGLVHGHQVIPNGDPDALNRLQRKLEVDILISGHTHRHLVMKSSAGLQINPGSATGAYSVQSSLESPPIPSFVLLDLEGTKATVYTYTLQEGKVKVDKLDHARIQST